MLLCSRNCFIIYIVYYTVYLYIFCIFVTIISNTITMLGAGLCQCGCLPQSVGPLLSEVVVVCAEHHRLHGAVRQLEHQAGRHSLVELKIFLKCQQFWMIIWWIICSFAHTTKQGLRFLFLPCLVSWTFAPIVIWFQLFNLKKEKKSHSHLRESRGSSPALGWSPGPRCPRLHWTWTWPCPAAPTSCSSTCRPGQTLFEIFYRQFRQILFRPELEVAAHLTLRSVGRHLQSLRDVPSKAIYKSSQTVQQFKRNMKSNSKSRLQMSRPHFVEYSSLRSGWCPLLCFDFLLQFPLMIAFSGE